MTKLVIANQDIDDPEDTREIEAVGLDLGEPDTTDAPSVPGAVAIERAADAAAKEQRAKQLIDEAHANLTAELKKLGYGLRGGKPMYYSPRPNEAYALWERVVPLLIQCPDMLDWKDKELVQWLNERSDFQVTARLFSVKLNEYSRKKLRKTLEDLGEKLDLTPPVTIASLRRQLVERQNAANNPDAVTFDLRVKVQGDFAFVNGKRYTIDVNRSGAPRIKLGAKNWVNLETLRKMARG